MIIPPVTPEYDSSAQAVLNDVLVKADGQNFKLDQDNFFTTGSICLQSLPLSNVIVTNLACGICLYW